jgi:hypothetical protein
MTVEAFPSKVRHRPYCLVLNGDVLTRTVEEQEPRELPRQALKAVSLSPKVAEKPPSSLRNGIQDWPERPLAP